MYRRLIYSGSGAGSVPAQDKSRPVLPPRPHSRFIDLEYTGCGARFSLWRAHSPHLNINID